MKFRSARGTWLFFIRPRDSGGGGPRAARWRGRRPHRFSDAICMIESATSSTLRGKSLTAIRTTSMPCDLSQASRSRSRCGRSPMSWLIAVELDCQPRGRTIEIEDVWTDRMLPAKDRLTGHAFSQPAPQPRLRRRHSAPKTLCGADNFRRRSHVPNLLRPLHRPSGGPPPPLSRGRMKFNASPFTSPRPPTMRFLTRGNNHVR